MMELPKSRVWDLVNKDQVVYSIGALRLLWQPNESSSRSTASSTEQRMQLPIGRN